MATPTLIELTDPKYIEMYQEYCFEIEREIGGNVTTLMTDKGYVDFVAWRKRVEALFNDTPTEGKWIGPDYQVHAKG